MQIFNRWGEVIFESFRLDEGWDGMHDHHYVQDDVYVYAVKYSMDGINLRTKHGRVTLIR
jgi:gliding motility-associated-like protein